MRKQFKLGQANAKSETCLHIPVINLAIFPLKSCSKYAVLPQFVDKI